MYKVPVTDIYLPASSWSDEVVYSKQLSAVVQYGAPQGYFGFNESHAEIGTFAAWGPALFWIYALPGFFLRGENAFIWCNLFFVVAGWLVFARAVRLSVPRQVLFAVVLACLNAPLRYIFSAMQEPFHYAVVLAVTGMAFLVRKSGRRPAWAALCILCAAATLVRPYNAVLWLYPLALAWPRRRSLAACLAGAAVSTAGTLVLMSRFYAPYFFTMWILNRCGCWHICRFCRRQNMCFTNCPVLWGRSGRRLPGLFRGRAVDTTWCFCCCWLLRWAA